MAWNDLASNECPTKADINARFKEYLNWQSRSITFDNSDYTVNPTLVEHLGIICLYG